MDRCTILECMYETIKESAEWGIDSDKYGHFVDGAVAVTEKMLERELLYKQRIDALSNAALLSAKQYLDEDVTA